jgi:hypothetical protein
MKINQENKVVKCLGMFNCAIIFIVCFSSAVMACDARPTSILIEKSKFIVEAVIKDISFKPLALKSCQIPKQVVKKVLKYTVTVGESLGRVLAPGDYSLSYEYVCDIHPTNPVFEQGTTVIFAIKSVEGQTITLVGDDCDWWGWDVSEKPMISRFLKAHCASREAELKTQLKSSRKCKQDYEELKSQYTGICKDPPLTNCSR